MAKIAKEMDANVKLVESPPGPPVISTVTAEVYGPEDGTYDELIAASKRVEARLAREPQIVDVDISAEADQPKWFFETDQTKAALSGVSKENVAQTLQLALSGMKATALPNAREVDPLQVDLRLKRSERSAVNDLNFLYLVGQKGQLVQLGAVGGFLDQRDGRPIIEDKTIYHKNLKRVAYVFGEVAGRPPGRRHCRYDVRPAGRWHESDSGLQRSNCSGRKTDLVQAGRWRSVVASRRIPRRLGR